MSFKSIDHVLGALGDRYQHREQQQLQRLLLCWGEVVGAAVMLQTRPTAIQRGVLKVATSSSAWAQNLTFERQRILEKLNQRLPFALVDIRFSTAHWQVEPTADQSPGLEQQHRLWGEHPSRVTPVPFRLSDGQPKVVTDPNSAFRRWAEVMRSRSQNLPLCPLCRCPTPPGELQRWSLCSLCMAKQWQTTIHQQPPGP